MPARYSWSVLAHLTHHINISGFITWLCFIGRSSTCFKKPIKGEKLVFTIFHEDNRWYWTVTSLNEPFFFLKSPLSHFDSRADASARPSAVRLCLRTEFLWLLVCYKFRCDAGSCLRSDELLHICAHRDSVLAHLRLKPPRASLWERVRSKRRAPPSGVIELRLVPPNTSSWQYAEQTPAPSSTPQGNAEHHRLFRIDFNFFFFFRLQNFQSQLHLYKNTFIHLSAFHQGHTADPGNFYNPKNLRRILESCFFLECFFP